MSEEKSGILWIRVSSKEQAEHGQSQDAQERELNEWAERNKIKVVHQCRIQESAQKPEERKQFKAMLEKVKAEKISNILATDWDRLARHINDTSTLLDLIDFHSVAVVLTSSSKIYKDPLSPEDRFMLQFKGSWAEMDNRERGRKIRKGMEQKARTGGKPGFAPVGYLNIIDQRKRIVVVDPDRKDLVRQAFELYATGKFSIDMLVAEMNRRGLTSKPGPKRPSGPVTYPLIDRILKDPFYYGKFKWSGHLWRCDKSHPALISKELFLKVQSRLRENLRYSKPDEKIYMPFRPFLKCGYCRSNITSEIHPPQNYIYYHCTHGQGKCSLPTFRQEAIDKIFTEALGELYINKPIAGRIREYLRQSHLERDQTFKAELKRLQGEQTRRTNQLSNLVDMLSDSPPRISRDEYDRKRAEYQNELDRVNQDLANAQKSNFNFREEASTILGLLKGIKAAYLKQDPKGKAAILRVVVDKVYLRTGRKGGLEEGKDLSYIVWREPFGILAEIAQFNKAGADKFISAKLKYR